MIEEIVWSKQAEIAFDHIIDRIAERFGAARIGE
jgi:plasmid stabilization system protein ParE